jgi:hypothetical protein
MAQPSLPLPHKETAAAISLRTGVPVRILLVMAKKAGEDGDSIFLVAMFLKLQWRISPTLTPLRNSSDMFFLRRR